MDPVLSLVAEGQEGCEAPFSFSAVIAIVIVSCVLGLIWSVFNMILVNKINVEQGHDGE